MDFQRVHAVWPQPSVNRVQSNQFRNHVSITMLTHQRDGACMETEINLMESRSR